MSNDHRCLKFYVHLIIATGQSMWIYKQWSIKLFSPIVCVAHISRDHWNTNWHGHRNIVKLKFGNDVFCNCRFNGDYVFPFCMEWFWFGDRIEILWELIRMAVYMCDWLLIYRASAFKFDWIMGINWNVCLT